ncbi:hypothetical protein B7463_g3736, partial [Scytalidium lignicola]
MSWELLPLEIRLVTLELIFCNGDTAAYATVSQEWQRFFEPKHFERVVLSQCRIKAFAQVVQGPKRKAGLTLELSAYSPSDSKHFFRDLRLDHDPYREPSKNFILFPDSKPIEHKFNDRWHLWRQGHRVPISQDEENYLIHGITRLQGRGFYFKPPPEGLPNDNDDRPPHSASEYLPKVDVVTSFLFRRQYYRHIHPDGLSQLFESLINLQHIIYEPPKVLYSDNSKRYQFVFERWLPTTLRKLTIYESHDERDESKHFSDSSGLLLPRSSTPALGLALAKASRPLEHLSVSFIVDAKHFLAFISKRRFPFSSINGQENDWHWANLTSLVLTSKLLAPNQTPSVANDLLLAASVAARSMPVLRVMEIWNGKNKVRTLSSLGCEDDDLEHGCIFRYYIDKDFSHSQGKSSRVSVLDRNEVGDADKIFTATITWHGTWHLELEQRVIQSWTKTVQRKGGQGISIETKRVPVDGTRFPASILRHLKLRDRVLHPISYQQIELLCTPRE